MKCLPVRVVLVLVWLLSACSIASAATVPDWMVRPGTIGHALSLSDGSQICLDAVIVDNIHFRQKPVYFTVRECFDWKSCLIVYAQPSPLLRHGQTIDVEGTLTTLPNGHRAIVRPKVSGYLDKAGKLLYHGPLIKWPWSRTEWEWKTDLTVVKSADQAFSTLSETETPPGEPNTDSTSGPVFCATIADARAQYSPTERVLVELQCRPLANPASGYFTLKEDGSADSITVYYAGSVTASDRINKLVGNIQKDAGTNYWLEVDSGPNWQSQDPVGSVHTATSGTIAWAKTFTDTTTLPAPLSGKVVSRTFPSLGYFYIQETARSSGIRVNDLGMASFVATGDTVDVEGELATDDGERVVDASSTTLVDLASVASVGLNGRSLAGGDFNVFTPGAYGAYGLNNVGLLVRVWGRVTAVGSDYFYLDDGSNCDDGSGSGGVRVVNVSGYMPGTDDHVAVTGVSGLATYDTDPARTVRLAHTVDLSGICPTLPPANLTIVPTGSGKLTLYWSGVCGATGYNVYRGTTSGGENYSTPINGGTPVTTESYSGSGVYTYTNTALTDGIEYFYTVKAVGGCGESQASEEDSCIPDPNGAPWDTGDVAAILASIRNSFPGVSIPYGCIRARGPDGRDYLDGISSPIIPDVTIDPTTRDVVFSDGTKIAPPNDIADIDSYTLGSMQILTTIEPRIKNAQSGPFRKVYTHHNYRGVKGRFRLPDSSVGIRVTPYTYPSTGKSTKDIPYVYLGGLGNRYTAVDAGLYWGPTANDPQSRWRMFGKIKNSKRDDWINTPPNGIFDDNQDVNAEYITSSTINGRVLLRITPVGGGQTGVITMDISDFPKTGQGVHLKRVHSIAQNNLIGTDKTNGYRRTGSYFQSSAWFDGQVMDQNGTYSNWGTSQTPYSTYHGRFPNLSSIVSFQLQFPQNLYPSKCFSGDLYVHITL